MAGPPERLRRAGGAGAGAGGAGAVSGGGVRVDGSSTLTEGWLTDGGWVGVSDQALAGIPTPKAASRALRIGARMGAIVAHHPAARDKEFHRVVAN